MGTKKGQVRKTARRAYEPKKGIYENKYGMRIKVSGKKPSKGWGQATVMNYTNNPAYGRSEFGMEGKYLKKFLKGFRVVK